MALTAGFYHPIQTLGPKVDFITPVMVVDLTLLLWDLSDLLFRSELEAQERTDLKLSLPHTVETRGQSLSASCLSSGVQNEPGGEFSPPPGNVSASEMLHRRSRVPEYRLKTLCSQEIKKKTHLYNLQESWKKK